MVAFGKNYFEKKNIFTLLRIVEWCIWNIKKTNSLDGEVDPQNVGSGKGFFAIFSETKPPSPKC